MCASNASSSGRKINVSVSGGIPSVLLIGSFSKRARCMCVPENEQAVW